ncbi:MAG: hypothetical protein IPI67_06395 [Myxococcales bacterium]|nr:hypothetical protein [Myxococcales bacterium]
MRHSSIGTGSSEQAARTSAQTGTCIAYCEHGDATVEALYKTWRASPAGQVAGSPRDKGVALGFVPDLTQANKKCQADCAAAVASGLSAVRTTCL